MAEAMTMEHEATLLMPPTRALTGGFVGDSASKTRKQNGAAAHVNRESRQGFRIGELQLMIRYEDGSELSEMPAIHRLPNAPDWFCGIANLHGKLTPVFDLARYLGVEAAPEARRMLLILSRGSNASGILIDGLPERLHWSADEYTDAGVGSERLMPHLLGACLIGDQLWFDLDCDSLLASIEQSLAT